MLIQLLIQNIIHVINAMGIIRLFNVTGILLNRAQISVARLRKAGRASNIHVSLATKRLFNSINNFLPLNVSLFTTTLLLQLTTLLFLTYSASHISPLHTKLLQELSHESPFLATKMQRKELDEQLEMLKTTIQEKQPSSNVISILKKLQMEVVPTEEILRVRPLCY
jgi:hypothetical protein